MPGHAGASSAGASAVGCGLASIRPFDAAAYIEELQCEMMAPSVKQQLAAIRMLCDWLVVGQVMPSNPASSVRGPKHVVKSGKTPVLEGTEWRRLMDAIPQENVRDLKDRALIAVLTYSFARIGAALQMRVEDMRPQGAGWVVRLHEKGGQAARYAGAPCAGGGGARLYGSRRDRRRPQGLAVPLGQGTPAGPLVGAGATAGACVGMIRRRTAAVGVVTPVGCHSFRATGIIAYLMNGGTLEHAQAMAGLESPRTTKLYDRTQERLTQDEVERIRF